MSAASSRVCGPLLAIIKPAKHTLRGLSLVPFAWAGRGRLIRGGPKRSTRAPGYTTGASATGNPVSNKLFLTAALAASSLYWGLLGICSIGYGELTKPM